MDIIRTIRLTMIFTNIPVMAVTIFVAYKLSQLPILNWSWAKLLGSEGGNVNLIGFQYLWFAPIFALLLIAALPLLAKAEEDIFREGTRDWGNAVLRSVLFGLVHVVAGIPIGAALALSIAGLWFTYQVRQRWRCSVDRLPHHLELHTRRLPRHRSGFDCLQRLEPEHHTPPERSSI